MIPDLIYDVGANNGDDTAHYLREGFRVVAIEANPALARQVEARFPREIAAGLLTVLNIGIWSTAGVMDFFVNEEHDEYSSFVAGVGGRDGARTNIVSVRTQTFDQVLAEYGVPYYLKVDIETADVHCLTGLSASELPRYLSIEAHDLGYLCLLYALGYRQFKCVDQSSHNWPSSRFDNESLQGRMLRERELLLRRVRSKLGRESRVYAPNSSGPFGEATPGGWTDVETVAYDWLHVRHGYRQRGTLNHRGWFDFHAKRCDSNDAA